MVSLPLSYVAALFVTYLLARVVDVKGKSGVFLPVLPLAFTCGRAAFPAVSLAVLLIWFWTSAFHLLSCRLASRSIWVSLAMLALSRLAIILGFVPLETRTAYGALLLAALPCRFLLPLTVRIMFLKLNLRWLRLILMLIVGSRSRLCCLMRASLSTLFRTMTFLVLGV
jgi:hypothetical protein